MIVGQGAVVVPEVERIGYGAVARAIIRLSVADSEHLSERVVRQEGDGTGLLLPRHLQRIVVRVTAMIEQINVLVDVQRTPIVGIERQKIVRARSARRKPAAGY